MRAGHLLASLIASGLAAAAAPLRRYHPEQDVRPFSRRPPGRSSVRSARRMAHSRYHNLKALEEARAKTAALNGNPPGYTYAHHDRLVRICGAVKTRELERNILRGQITFDYAVTLATAHAAA